MPRSVRPKTPVRKMSRRHRSCQPEENSGGPGFLNERVLVLVFKSMNWDPRLLCLAACVSRKLEAVAKRLLWRELCISRAPRMVAELTRGLPGGRVYGGWQALAKLFFFCCGSKPSHYFLAERSLPGHFVSTSRFSKTSGKSFLPRKCRGDLLYVSDPCEHPMGPSKDDVGVYRGVFKAFGKSRILATLLSRRIGLEVGLNCPYCRASVWSMTQAKLVPRSASRRLGSYNRSLEYFVCVNGHLHGNCWLTRLSSNDDNDDEDEDEDEDDSDCDAKDGVDDYYGNMVVVNGVIGRCGSHQE